MVLMLSLNDKLQIMLDMLEKQFDNHKSSMPLMLRSVYKPMIHTIRVFLIMTPEEILKKHLSTLQHFKEALECGYASQEDFKQHITELIKAWI